MFWKDEVSMLLLNQQSDATERMVSGRAPVSVCGGGLALPVGVETGGCRRGGCSLGVLG